MAAVVVVIISRGRRMVAIATGRSVAFAWIDSAAVAWGTRAAAVARATTTAV